MKFLRTVPLAVAVSLALAGGNSWSQMNGISAKPLMRTALSGDEGKETLIVAIEFMPGATTGRHVHPGDEYAVVVEGSLELRADGQSSRRVSAGQAYHNPRGVVHETVNVGDGPARTLATFVLDKGKPATSPAADK